MLSIRYGRLLVAATAMVACASRSGSRRDTAVVLAGAARDSSAVQRFVAALDTSCDFVQMRLHPDAAALVGEFVQRAGRGEFAEAEQWLPGAVTCIGHEPGYDTFEVADSVAWRPLDSAATRRRFELRLHGVGAYYSDTFHPADSLVIDTLVVVGTPFGWRMEFPDWNWISVAAAAESGWLADTARRQ